MKWFLLGDAVHQTAGEMPDGAIEVPRAPEMYERWNGAEWVMDERARADALAGKAHIDEARSLKYVEALAILNGVPLEGGMLALEAQEKGLDLKEYARLALEKRAAFIACEMQRQARQDGNDTDFAAVVADTIAGLGE